MKGWRKGEMEDRVTVIERGESNYLHVLRVECSEWSVLACVHFHIFHLGWAVCRTSVPGAQIHSLPSHGRCDC